MCGFAGIIGVHEAGALERMLEALAHRGPDDRGVHVDAAAGVAMAHARLSIIDPSVAGHQPMSRCGRYWMVYNGEVYNFPTLRAELEGLGYRFSSNTDSEVVLAAFAQWGEGCLHRFRGMFAFAVWDQEREELFLARDRFGIKPLYFSTADGRFLFASELRSLLESGLVARAADPRAILDYLAHGAVAQPRTILRDARSLLPGHFARVRGGEMEIVRYWDIAEVTAGRRASLKGIEYREAVRELREHLETATRLHLIADVPVGAFLSGGIDSSLVVGLMSRLTSHPIRTFAVGFDASHAHLNELEWARVAARHFGTDHTEVIVTAADAPGFFDRLLEGMDQPSIDGTNTFIVSEAARRDVTVSISGLGGDEIFAGYPHFRRLEEAGASHAMPIPFRHRVIQAAAAVLPGRFALPLETKLSDEAERLAMVRRLMRESEKRLSASTQLSAAAHDSPADRIRAQLRPELDAVGRVSYVELTGYLRDTLLRDADALSMCHSLEVRPVLLDHVLAEFAFALPGDFKLGETVGKRILIDAVRDLLPAGILTRPKMGFELPLMAWLKTTLASRALELLDTSSARALFGERFLAAAAAEICGGRSRSSRLWAYLVLIGYIERNGLTLGAG
jgi:asparagine synthase (glutamine-hydrolysing)